MIMNGILPLMLIIGTIGSLVGWFFSEIKGGQLKNIVLGAACLTISCAAMCFFTRLSCRIQENYERNFSVSVITKLAKMTQTEQAVRVKHAVENFLQEKKQDTYLPSLIKLNTELDEISRKDPN